MGFRPKGQALVRADPEEQNASRPRSNLVTLPRTVRATAPAEPEPNIDEWTDEEDGYGDWEDEVTRPTGPNPLLESAAREGNGDVATARANAGVPVPTNTNGAVEDVLRRGNVGAPAAMQSQTANERATEQAIQKPNDRAVSAPPRPAPGELAEVARIDPSGAVIHAADEATGDAVAYAARLASLVGELLGLESLRAMECASRAERLIVYTTADSGELVACRGALAEDATALRTKVGL